MLALAEMFYSVQGEGVWTGTPAVFVRLAGCNLNCRFCDTDYATKAFLSVDAIVTRVRELGGTCPMVIVTGGEPFAQAETSALIDALRADARRVHVESNGSIAVDLASDVWLTVSPKERLSPEMAARANEIKLIVDGRVPDEWLVDFGTRELPMFLQPEGNKPTNVALAVDAAKARPERFRLGLQTHKFIGIR